MICFLVSSVLHIFSELTTQPQLFVHSDFQTVLCISVCIAISNNNVRAEDFLTALELNWCKSELFFKLCNNSKWRNSLLFLPFKLTGKVNEEITSYMQKTHAFGKKKKTKGPVRWKWHYNKGSAWSFLVFLLLWCPT